jgi:hypothetical protein
MAVIPRPAVDSKVAIDEFIDYVRRNLQVLLSAANWVSPLPNFCRRILYNFPTLCAAWRAVQTQKAACAALRRARAQLH